MNERDTGNAVAMHPRRRTASVWGCGLRGGGGVVVGIFERSARDSQWESRHSSKYSKVSASGVLVSSFPSPFSTADWVTICTLL